MHGKKSILSGRSYSVWKIGTKACALVLVSSFLFSTGCKKKKEMENRIVKETDPYFSCEEIELKIQLPGDEEKELKRRTFGQAKFFSDCVLVPVSEEYVMPDEFLGKWNKRYEDYSVTDNDRQKLQEEYDSYHRNCLAVFGLDGTMKSISEIQAPSHNVEILEDPSGNPKVVEYVTSGTSYTAILYDVSPEGDLINEIRLERQMTVLGKSLFMGNGNLLVSDQYTVCTFSQSGKLLSEQTLIAPIDGFFKIEGRYYAHMTIHDVYAEETTPPATYMFEIDPSSGKKKGEKIDITGTISGEKLEQGHDGVYSVTGNGIQKFDLFTGTAPQMILSWEETDCTHSLDGFWNQGMYFVSEEEIYMTRLTNNQPPRMFESSDYSIRLVHLQRMDKNPHAGKKLIRLAFLGNLNFQKNLLEYINEFNLNPEGRARIVVKDYSGDSSLQTSIYGLVKASTEEQAMIADQVYLEILSGEGPDILLNFGSYSQFNTERVLVDLNTLIDGESQLDRSLLFDNILRAYERNGKLYQMPLNFAVTGMVANKDYVGDRTGWTFEEFQSISKSLPETVKMLGSIPQNDLLTSLMRSETSRLLDYDNRQVKFDDSEFKDILTLVKEYGTPKTRAELQKEMGEDFTGTILDDEQLFGAGMIVAMEQTFDTLYKFGNIDALCDGNVCFIGYPNADGSGALADDPTSIAIAQSCPYKDEAWEFVKSLLEDDIQIQYVSGSLKFPVNRKAFDSLMEISIEDNQLGWELAETDPDIKMYMMASYTHLTQDDVTKLKAVIESIHNSCSFDPSALMIIQEEAPGYFTDQRTIDDVVNIIQKRSSAVVQERG